MARLHARRDEHRVGGSGLWIMVLVAAAVAAAAAAVVVVVVVMVLMVGVLVAEVLLSFME